MTSTAVWLDGVLVAPHEASLSVFDHGITVGDGVFETLKVTGGVPFALRRHIARLARSAAGLGLEVQGEFLAAEQHLQLRPREFEPMPDSLLTKTLQRHGSGLEMMAHFAQHR